MEQLPKIVQRRLQDVAKPGVHPDPDLLTAFVEKSLTERERSQVLQHLAHCRDCREVISLATPELESKPSPRDEKSRGLSWPLLRWGALAACVVVVSAAVTLHYEGRKAGEISVAEKAPEAPASLSEKKGLPEEPREKLVTNIPIPPPLASGRDLDVASKLAKQRAKSMDAATIVTGPGAYPQRQMYQREKDQALSNNRMANATTFKPADKMAASAASGGAVVAAAPLPSVKAAPTSSQAKVRNDTVNSVPSIVTETVTVEAAGTSAPEAANAAEGKAKKESAENDSRIEVQAERIGGVSALAIGGRKADSLSTTVEQTATGNDAKRSRAGHAALRWTLTDGALQRSFDSGKTWQTIQVDRGIGLRALSVNDSDIWVGGVAGALYHSFDAGQHWVRVSPGADGESLAADITTLEFSDAQHGKLTTGDHETWTTSDAGNTWQKR